MGRVAGLIFKMEIQFLKLLLILGAVSAQVSICPDKKTVCQSFEACVTWERGCSVGANCLAPGLFEIFSECIQLSEVQLPLLPSKPLCTEDEVFARSVDKRCPRFPCPLRLGYNCYSASANGFKPSCQGIRCPFGMFCSVGESCTDVLCEPTALCSIKT